MTASSRTLQLPPINAQLLPDGVSRLFFPPIPVHFYPQIGAVAAFWGYFELRMDELLASFVQADQSDDDAGWQRRNFKKRRALLKDKAAKHFPGAISNEIGDILGLSATYHWQRNIIVHGHFGVTNVDGLPAHAEGVHNGKLVKLPVDNSFLEKLYHQIAILTARLVMCTDPDPGPGENPDPHTLSLHDRALLLDFVRKHPPNLPTPQILSRQDPPSAGNL